MAHRLPTQTGLSHMLGLGVSDIHGRLLEVNDEYLRILGYTRDDFEQGRFQWDKCTAPEHLMRDHRAIQDVVATGRCAPYEKDYIRKDGRPVRVLIGLSPLGESRDRFDFFAVDLSKSPRDDTYMTDAVNAANTGTWDWNIPTGRFIWSAKTASLLGFDPSAERSYDNLWRRIHPEDRAGFRQQLEAMLANRREEQVEFRVCPPNEPERWLFAKGAIFFNQAGEPVRASGTLVDISEWKRNEQALEDAVGARNQFLAVASHELRTPLTSIRLRAEMLLRKGLGAANELVSFAQLQGSIESIVRQVTRLDVLVRDMLDASRLLHGKLNLSPEALNVTRLLETVVRNARNDHPEASNLVWEAPDDDALRNVEAHWTRPRVEQVLRSLLNNAMTYGEGRPVVVRLADVVDDWATIEVVDGGIGIAAEDHERIFHPFERVNPNVDHPGFGLGLFIASEIVKAQGGRVSVESRLGAGSTFRVHLPLKHPRRR